MHRAAGMMAVLLIASAIDGGISDGAPVPASADGGSGHSGERAFCGFYPVPEAYACCNSHYMAYGHEVVRGTSCTIDSACGEAPSQATCSACHQITFAVRPEPGIPPHYGGQQPDGACRGCHPRPWPQSLR